jgi:hypothetical protein
MSLDKLHVDWEILLSELMSTENEMNNLIESQNSVFMARGRPGSGKRHQNTT